MKFIIQKNLLGNIRVCAYNGFRSEFLNKDGRLVCDLYDLYSTMEDAENAIKLFQEKEEEKRKFNTWVND